MVIAVGDSFDQYDGTGSTAELEATITLMSVEADPICAYEDTELQADASQGGTHHVALELTVDAASDRPGFVNAPNFDVAEQLPEGLTSTSVAHSTERSSCLPDRPILDTVDSGTKVRGWMLFAVENATGSLLWLNGGESPGVTIAYAASPRTSTTTAASTTTTAPRPVPTTTIAPAPTTTSAPAPAVSQPSAASTPEEECFGYGCSPEQDAELNEQEAAANDDYGPGCNYQLCGSDLPENQPGYVEQEDLPQSSGEVQLEYGCQQGYIVGPECDGY